MLKTMNNFSKISVNTSKDLIYEDVKFDAINLLSVNDEYTRTEKLSEIR